MRPLHQPTTQTRLRPFKPTQFGRYTLLMPLASGGMGEIFLARLEGVQGFEKQCVIKKILPHLTQEEDFVTRFVNEAKTLVQLQHGSIAQVLDMGLHEGEPYLALEFVDGKDLRKVAARARERNMPLPLTFVLYTMSRVLDALAYAHRKRDDEEKEIGLVHRDVSPQNILISYEGEVKVIDFGLAKSTLNVSKTNPSIVLGKFLYMSPEQARHAKVDRRTDLYSVGLCLYELVAGKNPFDDVPPGELMAKVATPTIPNIQQVEPLCPGPVAQTVMKALAVDPSQRYQTAEEFRGRLMAVLVDIDPSAGPESCSKFMREAFSAEYNSERKLLASLREQRLTPAAPAMMLREREPEVASAKKDSNAAIKNLNEIARRSIEMPFGEELTPMPTDPRRLRGNEPPEWTPTPLARSLDEQPELPRAGQLRGRLSEKPTAPTSGLSFAPTPRLKEDDGRAAQTDRETMPSINLLIAPGATDAHGDPVTSRAMVVVPEEAYRSGQLPIVGELLEPIPMLKPSSPWSANETTTPAGPAFEGVRGETPLRLPAVITSEPSETYEPGRLPVQLEGRRASLPMRPVVAPLPQALKNKLPPDERPESTGKTTTSRSGFMWVVIPLLAVLGVAGFVLHDLYQDQLAKTLEEMERNQKPLGPSGLDDRRSREVPPTQPQEHESTEPFPEPTPEPVSPERATDATAPAPVVAPVPAPAPAPPPAAAAEGELSPLTPQPPPPAAKPPPKRKIRQR